MRIILGKRSSVKYQDRLPTSEDLEKDKKEYLEKFLEKIKTKVKIEEKTCYNKVTHEFYLDLDQEIDLNLM